MTDSSAASAASTVTLPADKRTPTQDAEKLPSGLASVVIRAGQSGGGSPGLKDIVTVHYTGWTAADGGQFDTTFGGEACEFETDGIMPGWTEGLMQMAIGETRRWWIPSQLAYGETSVAGRPIGALVFDIELINIQTAPGLKPKMGGFTQRKEDSVNRPFKSPW
eukprot:CAMPEP_0196578448 /NCGR_PEP_ID=MMETSP1081-20130531/7338_1 /TAXON_ID=36882 /ORGANISM="Pyramimonas amylifera, Strain CCMP720" /LENGTH=163 /DNA_ID=CAMNT_0041897661 /DNA_START=438 /DNA_END=926 /DNA_ORIENTATION=+